MPIRAEKRLDTMPSSSSRPERSRTASGVIGAGAGGPDLRGDAMAGLARPDSAPSAPRLRRAAAPCARRGAGRLLRWTLPRSTASPAPGLSASRSGSRACSESLVLIVAGTVVLLAAALVPARVRGIRPAVHVAVGIARLFIAVTGIRLHVVGRDALRAHRGFVFYQPPRVAGPGRAHGRRAGPLSGGAGRPPDPVRRLDARRPSGRSTSTEGATTAARRRADALRAAVARSPLPVALAPEGGIGPGPGVLPLRHGAFEVAQDADADILLVALAFEPPGFAVWERRDADRAAVAALRADRARATVRLAVLGAALETRPPGGATGAVLAAAGRGPLQRRAPRPRVDRRGRVRRGRLRRRRGARRPSGLPTASRRAELHLGRAHRAEPRLRPRLGRARHRPRHLPQRRSRCPSRSTSRRPSTHGRRAGRHAPHRRRAPSATTTGPTRRPRRTRPTPRRSAAPTPATSCASTTPTPPSPRRSTSSATRPTRATRCSRARLARLERRARRARAPRASWSSRRSASSS